MTPPVTPAPPVVRPERGEDHDAVRRVAGAAFGGEKVPALLDELRGSLGWLDLSFVAERAGEVVGHVSYSRAWIDTAARLLEVLVLSPLSVRPDLQRTGIGSLLVRDTLGGLSARGEPLVFLEGAPGFYSRLGFVAAADLGFGSPSVRIPERAFQVATLTGFERGWMSGAFVYPDLWWRHDAVGLRPER